MPSSEIDKIAFIETKSGQVLCARSHGRTKYYIPGGKREAGESDEQTLIREVQEELSVNVVPGSSEYVGTFWAQADGQPEGVTVKMTCYRAQYSGALRASREIAEVRWLKHKDIDQVAEVDKKIFAFLKEAEELS